MISDRSSCKKHYPAHVPHSKAITCTNDYVELYTALSNQLGLRPNTNVAVSLRQYEVNTCVDALGELEVVTLAALLPKAKLLTRVQLWGKKFQTLAKNPDIEVCASTPGASIPTTSRSRDKLEYARRTYKYPNEQDKSLSEIHEDPGTICASRNPDQTVKLAKGLSLNLQSGGRIREIRLVGLKLSKESISLLADGFKKTEVLDYLCINFCRLTDQNFAVLASALCSAVKLRKLDLSNNDLMDTCGFDVGRMISKNAERKDEVVWASGLRGEAQTMDPDDGLQDICLANNKVSDKAIYDLGRVLYCDVYLKVLDLRRNRLSSQGIRDVLSIVTSNNSLLMVDIRENGLDERSSEFRMIGYKITTKLMKNLKVLKTNTGYVINPEWEGKLAEFQVAYFSPEDTPFDGKISLPSSVKRKDTPKQQSSASSLPRSNSQNIYIDDIPYEDLAGSHISESASESLPPKPPNSLGSPHTPLHLVNKKAHAEHHTESTSPCSKCREYERVLYKTESNCVALTLENNQLKKALRTASQPQLQQPPPAPLAQLQVQQPTQPRVHVQSQHSWSNSAISNLDQHTYLPGGESISMTGYSVLPNQKHVQGGTGEETESGVLHRIEVMMSELTRLMDTLELSHRTPALHPTASESFSPSRTQVIAP